MAEAKTPGIRSEYQPTDKEAEVLKHVYRRYDAMKNSEDRKKAETNWNKWEKQWEALREPNEGEDWQSNHYVPLTTAVVETALAEIVDQTPQPLILPQSADDAPKATVMSHIFKYTWDTADGDAELYNVLKDTLIFGTGIAQEYYFKDRRLIRNVTVDAKGNETYTEEESYDFDDCYMESVKLTEFFVDETARYIGIGPFAARDCIRRYIMDIEVFKSFFAGPVWNPLDNVKYVTPGGDVNYYEFYKPPEGIDKSKQVEVLWYWSKKPEDALNIVANDVIIRMGPNIYKHKQLPFSRCVDIKRPHRFYGKGEAELLESTNDEINTLRRMVIDRNHLDIDKMFIVAGSESLNDEDLIARPHGLIPSDSTDPNAVRAVEYGDIPRSVELSIKLLGDDATIATGIDPRLASLPQVGTATQAAIIKESALKRIRMKMRIVEREFLTNVARLRTSNILQFYPQPRLEQIVGKEGTQEFQQEVQKLQDQGLVETVGNVPMKKTYRSIRLENKALNFNEKGVPQESSISGFSFFELKPEYFMPSARGGYDIKFAAGSTIPISKPLQQSKYTEMYDRLIQLALGAPGTFDPLKLGDGLLRVNDYNPSDFHAEQPSQQGGASGTSDARASQLTELAIRENDLMMKGQQVAPTAFATPAHTEIHAQFMHSPPFQQLPPNSPVVQIFTNHAVGEMMAQKQRGMAGTNQDMMNGGQPGNGLPPQPQTQVAPKGKRLVGDTTPTSSTVPAMIQGSPGAQPGI